jgi:biopolymer transport protein ExbB/TolQ
MTKQLVLIIILLCFSTLVSAYDAVEKYRKKNLTTKSIGELNQIIKESSTQVSTHNKKKKETCQKVKVLPKGPDIMPPGIADMSDAELKNYVDCQQLMYRISAQMNEFHILVGNSAKKELALRQQK